MRSIVAALTLTLSLTAAVQAAVVGGVKLPDTVSVNGQNLTLNGAGLRKKLFIKVYAAGLYLPARQKNPTAIIAADTARQMTMHFVFDVEKAKIAEAWTEGLTANTPTASADVKAAFTKLAAWMEDMKKGQNIVMTYVPNVGTSVVVNGTNKGTLAGKAVNDAILATWIGPKPGPGEEFKTAILGK